MRVAGEIRAELPEEFTDPVGYADRWLWFAIVLAVLLAAYFVLAWWFTRRPRPPRIARREVALPDIRERHLARIAEIETQVAGGAISPRQGHQQLSETVRDFIAIVTPLPARSMALADFRRRAPTALVEVLEIVYPPEFAPDDDHAREAFEVAVTRSRSLIGSWTAETPTASPAGEAR